MMIILMIMNVEYIWLTWINEMQIILYCFVQGSPFFTKWSKSADILKFCPGPARPAPSIPGTHTDDLFLFIFELKTICF